MLKFTADLLASIHIHIVSSKQNITFTTQVHQLVPYFARSEWEQKFSKAMLPLKALEL